MLLTQISKLSTFNVLNNTRQFNNTTIHLQRTSTETFWGFKFVSICIVYIAYVRATSTRIAYVLCAHSLFNVYSTHTFHIHLRRIRFAMRQKVKTKTLNCKWSHKCFMAWHANRRQWRYWCFWGCAAGGTDERGTLSLSFVSSLLLLLLLWLVPPLPYPRARHFFLSHWSATAVVKVKLSQNTLTKCNAILYYIVC